MSDAMDYINRVKETQRLIHSDRIKKVKNFDHVPQNILAMKSIADDFITENNGYITNDEGFFFTEGLVNRLMYLAYLAGKDEAENHVKYTRILESTINDVKNLVNSL